MIEITSNAAIQNGIRKAHQARGEALNKVFEWLFGRRISR